MNLPLPPSEDLFEPRPDARLLLSGSAAAARGILEAGAGFVLTYPGSPVVETYEALAAPAGPAADRCRIAVNEHVAWHEALGYALCGGRTAVIMKHVGFHVASDPAHYSAYLGVRGGFVAVIGDDPGANCSTGEFDVRFQALHAHLPVVEPADFQETLDLTREAFALSETIGLPVLVVLPAGLCHGVGTATAGPIREPRRDLVFTPSPDLTSVGARAVRLHERLLERIDTLRHAELPHAFAPRFEPGAGHDARAPRDLIVAPSIQFDMVREYLQAEGPAGRPAVWSPRLTYPLPADAFDAALAATGARRILCLEPLEGFLEHQIGLHLARRGGPPVELHGKDLLPASGEPTVARVRSALARFLGRPPEPAAAAAGIPAREGTFCPGCPHRAFFYLLNGVLRDGDVIGGDIGCSSLPPHHADWLTCMNSGASIAAGVAKAVTPGLCLGPHQRGTAPLESRSQRVVSLIGDSTLLHSGLQTVLECAQTDSNQLLFVLDNGWTAMTGHQPTPATPDGRDGRRNPDAVDLRKILAALGVRDLHELDPKRIRGGRALIRKLLDRPPGFACVLVRRECALQAARRAKGAPEPAWRERFAVVPERCRACGECYAVLTCPAIDADAEGIARIDPQLCVACGACHDACPNGAILKITMGGSAPQTPAKGVTPLETCLRPDEIRDSQGSMTLEWGVGQRPTRNMFNVIITGLGGQGILFVSRLLRRALGARRRLTGWDNRGGAQRFGHVAAVIRSTAGASAPLALDLPAAACDALIALEASESLRFLDKAGPDTLVLLDRYLLVPTNVRRAKVAGPDADSVAARFRERGARVVLDDFRAKAADRTGDARNANLLMLGRLLAETGDRPLIDDLAAAAGPETMRIVAIGAEP